MKTKSFRIQRLYLGLLASILLLASCSGNLASKTSSSTDGVGNPPVGVVDETRMYVRIFDEGKFPYFEQKEGVFNTECKVNVGDPYGVTTCYVDVLEGDLYFHGLTFQYNVPSEICDYFIQMPYWYWDFEPGKGPTSVSLGSQFNAEGTYLAPLNCRVGYEDGTSQNCGPLTFADFNVNTGSDQVVMTDHDFVTGDAGELSNTNGTLPAGLTAGTYYIIRVDANTVRFATTFANSQSNTAVDITAAAGGGTHMFSPQVSGVNLEADIKFPETSASCVYDHTLRDGPNCCFGDYTFTSIRRTPTPPDTITGPQARKWAGNAAECIGGAARTSWSFQTVDGFPAYEVQYVAKEGVNAQYKVTPPIQAPKTGSNRVIANFYKSTDLLFSGGTDLHSHNGFVDARVSKKPYPIDPVDDRSGSAFYNPGASGWIRAGNDSYSWYCTDRAWETRYGIKVYVREWNTMEEFGKWNGTLGDPDVDGDEGSGDCGYEPPFPSNEFPRCNDLVDLDDFAEQVITIFGSAYPTNVGSESFRRYYFPEDFAD